MTSDDAADAELEEGADPEIPDYLRLLWFGEDETRRGPKRGASLAAIGRAGVRIADESGLAAVSMRAVAAALGLSTMALYRYLPSKDDLLVLLIDTAYGPPDLAFDPHWDWRQRLTAFARADRAALRAHPWILQVPLAAPPLTPNTNGWTETGLAAFAGTALDWGAKLSSLLLIEVYVRGQTQLTLGLATGDESALYAARLAALIDPVAFPNLSAALASGSLSDDTDLPTDEFEAGLHVILDGIAARISGVPGGRTD